MNKSEEGSANGGRELADTLAEIRGRIDRNDGKGS
jgi:hypothetical protein